MITKFGGRSLKIQHWSSFVLLDIADPTRNFGTHWPLNISTPLNLWKIAARIGLNDHLFVFLSSLSFVYSRVKETSKGDDEKGAFAFYFSRHNLNIYTRKKLQYFFAIFCSQFNNKHQENNLSVWQTWVDKISVLNIPAMTSENHLLVMFRNSIMHTWHKVIRPKYDKHMTDALA